MATMERISPREPRRDQDALFEIIGAKPPSHRCKQRLPGSAWRETLIANDTAMPKRGIGKLISAGTFDRIIVSHIGLNPETQDQMNEGVLQVDLSPQGTLVECIRAAGVGLGAVVT